MTAEATATCRLPGGTESIFRTRRPVKKTPASTSEPLTVEANPSPLVLDYKARPDRNGPGDTQARIARWRNEQLAAGCWVAKVQTPVGTLYLSNVTGTAARTMYLGVNYVQVIARSKPEHIAAELCPDGGDSLIILPAVELLLAAGELLP